MDSGSTRFHPSRDTGDMSCRTRRLGILNRTRCWGHETIAEAWMPPTYQVGSFGDSGRGNGRFRGRRPRLRGAEGSVKRFADRMIGSPEVTVTSEREPE
jgi:pullulanase/glycogen debranching enzyme